MSTNHRTQLPIRVAVADGRGLVREGVCLMLNRFADVTLVGGVRDGDELLELVRSRPVDVVLLDMEFPPEGGLIAARQLLESNNPTRVIFVSVLPEEQQIRQVIEAGACGFLLIDAGVDELKLALYAAADGCSFICPSLFRKWLAHQLMHRQPLPGLSPEAVRLGEMLADGHSLEQMASELSLQPAEVEVRRQALMAQLDLAEAEAMLERAIRMDLLGDAPQ